MSSVAPLHKYSAAAFSALPRKRNLFPTRWLRCTFSVLLLVLRPGMGFLSLFALRQIPVDHSISFLSALKTIMFDLGWTGSASEHAILKPWVLYKTTVIIIIIIIIITSGVVKHLLCQMTHDLHDLYSHQYIYSLSPPKFYYCNYLWSIFQADDFLTQEFLNNVFTVYDLNTGQIKTAIENWSISSSIGMWSLFYYYYCREKLTSNIWQILKI